MTAMNTGENRCPESHREGMYPSLRFGIKKKRDKNKKL